MFVIFSFILIHLELSCVIIFSSHKCLYIIVSTLLCVCRLRLIKVSIYNSLFALYIYNHIDSAWFILIHLELSCVIIFSSHKCLYIIVSTLLCVCRLRLVCVILYTCELLKYYLEHTYLFVIFSFILSRLRLIKVSIYNSLFALYIYNHIDSSWAE